jgi:putative spermidine/putrescine transport system permease protein
MGGKSPLGVSDAGSGALAVLRGAVVAGIVLAVVMPVIPLIIWSFSAGWWFPDLLPGQFSVRAWQSVFAPASRVAAATLNSFGIAAATTAICVVIGVPAGRALGMYRFRSKRVVESLILAPLLVPGLTVVMGVQVLFIRVGLSATRAGVVCAHLLPALPYMIMVMRGVFANFDPEYEDQAHSLGAGRRKTFFCVTLPAIQPGIVTGALFVFLISWSQYILTLLVGAGRVITLPVLLFAYANAGDHAVTGAVSVVFLMPALLVLLATSRYLTGRSVAVAGLGRL